MASNPLQTQVMGGGLDTPTAGVEVATPTLQGAPVVFNRSISELMGAISGAAEAVTDVAKAEIRSNRINAELSAKQREDLENSRYHALKKEKELFDVQIQTAGPELTTASDAYKDYSVRLKEAMNDTSTSPFFQYQIASIYQEQSSYIESRQRQGVSDARQLKEDAERDARNRDREGYELSKNIGLQIDEAVAGGMSLEDAIKNIADPFREVPQVDFMARKRMLDDRAEKLDQATKMAQQDAKETFLNGASNLNNMFATLKDPHLEDPENFRTAKSSVEQSITDMFENAPLGDLQSLIGISSEWAESVAQIELAGPSSDNQVALVNAATARYNVERTKYIDKITTKVQSTVDSKIDLASVGGVYSPEKAIEIVENAINGQMGEKTIKWDDQSGFTATNPEFDEIAAGAERILQPMAEKWQAGAPKRAALQKISGTGVLREDDLKVAGFDFKTASVFDIANVASRMPQGIGAGPFKSDIEAILDNPMLPDGSPDMENINKVLAVTKGMNIAQSILVQGDSTLNDPRTVKLLRLSLWAAATEAKEKGRLSETADRSIFGPITGATQARLDLGSFRNFMEAPMDLAGSDKDTKIPEASTQDVLRRHPGLQVGHPVVDLLKYTDRIYSSSTGGRLDDKAKAMFDQQILKSYGLSMYTATDGSTTLHPDEYGHTPKDPADTARRAMEYIPELGSPLHVSAIRTWKQDGPVTNADIAATDGMPLSEIYNRYQKDLARSSSVIVKNVADFPDSQVNLVDRGAEAGKATLSNYNFSDLFGYGVYVSGGNNQNTVLKVNSMVERLLNDPASSGMTISRAKTAAKVADDLVKQREGPIVRTINSLLHPQRYNN